MTRPSLPRWVERYGIWLVAAVAAANVTVAGVSAPVRAPTQAPEVQPSEPAPIEEPPDEVPPTSGGDASGSVDTKPLLLDPQVVYAESINWAVGSGVAPFEVPYFEQTPDGQWVPDGDALTSSASWAGPGAIGPSVLSHQGRWWLFFAAPDRTTGRYCLGLSSADDPGEGFVPRSEPLLCSDDADAIDPTPFRDGDQLWLLWSERQLSGDPQDPGTGTSSISGENWTIRSAALDLGSGTLDRNSVLLAANTSTDQDTWEGSMLDAPAMVEVDETLVLLYGGNRWGTPDYGVGYATCTSVSGPCDKQTNDGPLPVPATVEPFLESESQDGTQLAAAGGLQPILARNREPAVTFAVLLLDQMAATPQAAAAVFEASISLEHGELHLDDVTQLGISAE